ncbi:MAG TPA: lyase family protein, partial [Solirubrobacteraceae bacterium]
EDYDRLSEVIPWLNEINMGATAIGTGITADPRYAELVREHLVEVTGIPMETAPDLIEATSDAGIFMTLSSNLKRAAVKLSKICNDLRLTSSGPQAGLGEINLPPRQAGSSIMPGKVNPVIPEVVLQVSAQVIGNDTAITVAGLQGQFELNVRIPLIARNLLQSLRLLSAASRAFAEKCVDGIEANRGGTDASAGATLAVATALNGAIGYDKATVIVKKATASGRPLREVALEEGVDAKLYDATIDLRKIARGNRA